MDAKRKELRKDALLSLWDGYETTHAKEDNPRYRRFADVLSKTEREGTLSFEERDALENGTYVWFDLLLEFVCECDAITLTL